MLCDIKLLAFYLRPKSAAEHVFKIHSYVEYHTKIATYWRVDDSVSACVLLCLSVLLHLCAADKNDFLSYLATYNGVKTITLHKVDTNTCINVSFPFYL